MLKRYRLADLNHMVPMPDRGGRLFSREPRGEMIDTEHPFYLSMIADRDLVEVGAAPARAASEHSISEQSAARGKHKGK